MNIRKLILLALLLAALASLLLIGIASAHNAAHIILPSGECLNVGSLEEAPLVPESNPNRNSDGQLDLIPGSGDQYGARYAATMGNSALLPGECP